MRAALHEITDPNAVELHVPAGYYFDLLMLDGAMWTTRALNTTEHHRRELNTALVVFGRPYTFGKGA